MLLNFGENVRSNVDPKTLLEYKYRSDDEDPPILVEGYIFADNFYLII